MKEQKKSKSLEIVEKQRALVVEKIIEDMKRDRDVERAPEKVSLKGEVTAMKDAAKSHDEQAKAPEIAVSAR